MKPQPFGRFLLLDKVASGGMAEVWRAKLVGESGFQRIVAIKKILPHVSEDADFITMFTDEAKITVQLQHSNIGQVYEFDKIDGLFYIAMEYISGKDLKTIWSYQRSRKTTIPVDFACYIVQQMAEGLDYAHRKKDNFGNDLGIVHRDVSPQNCLISWDGEVKVIDFGIAKAAEKGGRTRAGTLKGKFAYMSPEQIRGLPLDGRADVFALGVVLYELVTGERGFQAESEFSLLEMVRNVEIKPPTMVNKEIPQELERIIFKALAKDREHRYRWGSDLAEDLQRYLLNRGKPPRASDVGKFLRENFTVDYDKERLRLESYKEIEWEPPVRQAAAAAAAAEAALPQGSDLPPAPPPASLAAVQAALLEEGQGDGAFAGNSGTFANPGEGTFAPSSTQTGVRGQTRSGTQPGAQAGTNTGYVIAGYREEITANRTPTHAGIAPSMNVTLPGTLPPVQAGGSSGAGVKIVVGLLALLVLLAGAVVTAWLVIGGSSGTINLTVRGAPDAEVLLDGQPAGTANPSLTLTDVPAGVHDLILQKDGYQSEHHQVTVTAGKVVPLSPTLAPAPAKLNIVTEPSGAKILILANGKVDDCTTPCQLNVTPDSPLEVTATHEGYFEAKSSVKVPVGSTEDIKLVLRPTKIVINIKTVPPGALLQINRKNVGKTPYVYEHDPALPPPKAVFKMRGCETMDTSITFDDNKPRQDFVLELGCR